MTNVRKSSTEKREYFLLITYVSIYFILLFLRDAYSVPVNKIIFIALTCLCAVTLKTKHIIYLICFLMPVYVGLPGNYMTIIFTARLACTVHEYKKSSFMLSFLISLFILWQNFTMGTNGIVQMMFIVGIIFVLFLFSYKGEIEKTYLIIMYTAGVAALGFIMLISTLQIYEFNELLSTSFRLGSGSVNYVEQGIMNVSIDPNFYGCFVIASISTVLPIVIDKNYKMWIRTCLSIFAFIETVICFIGLSRAFLLVLSIWTILFMFSQKKIKSKIIVLLLIVFITILFIHFFPNVLQTIFNRFDDVDMTTGNGRTTLVSNYFGMWCNSIYNFMFGIGLFKCTVHCMPLQFLFGGGVVLFLLMFMLVISYRSMNNKAFVLLERLPIIVTLVMMCTVPAAGILNFMFPIIYVGLVMKDSDLY